MSDEPHREPCHAPARPRRGRREPVWLRDYVRTVVVYPTCPLNFVRTFVGGGIVAWGLSLSWVGHAQFSILTTRVTGVLV